VVLIAEASRRVDSYRRFSQQQHKTTSNREPQVVHHKQGTTAFPEYYHLYRTSITKRFTNFLRQFKTFCDKTRQKKTREKPVSKPERQTERKTQTNHKDRGYTKKPQQNPWILYTRELQSFPSITVLEKAG
jgi:hypothetical protein